VHFFRGDVYSSRWITDSITSGKLLDKDDYFRYDNTGDGIKRIDFGRGKVIYTITEAIKIFELGQNNKINGKGA
jgi:hypothetical protein